MRAALILTILMIAASGCAKDVWHREDVVEWSRNFRSRPPDIRYCGSDSQWHYFLSHPIDWVFITVPRSEIDIPEEFPPAKSGTWYYYVDPLNEFQKVSDLKAQRRPGL